MDTTAQTPRGQLQAAIRRFQEGDRSGGLAACRAVVAAHPDDDEGHYALALMLLQAGDLVQGIDELDLILASRPDHADALASRGAARLRMGETAAAAVDLRHALGINPRLADAWLALASLHRNEEDWQACRDVLRQAAKTLPDHPGIRSNLASLTAERGDP